MSSVEPLLTSVISDYLNGIIVRYIDENGFDSTSSECETRIWSNDYWLNAVSAIVSIGLYATFRQLRIYFRRSSVSQLNVDPVIPCPEKQDFLLSGNSGRADGH